MNERKNFWWALLDPFSAYYDKTIFLPGSNLESGESKEERERERNSENKIKTHIKDAAEPSETYQEAAFICL